MIRFKIDNEYELATCGLSCDLCDANTPKIQNAAKYLIKVFEDPMFSGVLMMTNPEFNKENIVGFKETLEILNKFPPCPGCQERRDCVINQCTREKGIVSCSECSFLDVDGGICKAVPEPPKNPMMPPAPVYFNCLAKRYQNWNVENLIALSKGQKQEVDTKIAQMIKDGKISRELIDISVNLFDMKR